jgi:nitroimidazol reductase NimA-like FMN-containing flavoprotein (pyridoxamine 5'-phosphate oxidase superfamily)
MIRANPNVCYVVKNYFGDPKDLADGVRCHGNWESVIAYGKARVVEDPEELRKAFTIFMSCYSPTYFEPGENSVKTTRAVIIDIESMTARREVPREGFNRKTGEGKVDVDYWSWSPE